MYRWKDVRICLPTFIYTAFAIYYNAIIPAHGTLDEHRKHFLGNVAIKKRSSYLGDLDWHGHEVW